MLIKQFCILISSLILYNSNCAAQKKITTFFYKAFSVANSDTLSYRYTHHKVETIIDNKIVLEEYFNDENDSDKPRRSIGKIFSKNNLPIFDSVVILAQLSQNKNYLHYTENGILQFDSVVYAPESREKIYKLFHQYFYTENNYIDSISYFLYRDPNTGLNEGFKKYLYGTGGKLASITNNFLNQNLITLYTYKGNSLIAEVTTNYRTNKEISFKKYNKYGAVAEEKTEAGTYLYYEYTYDTGNQWKTRIINEEFGRRKKKLKVIGKEVRVFQ